jgi:cytochrome c peroxidase
VTPGWRRHAAAALMLLVAAAAHAESWTPAEQRMLRSLWIGGLGPVPDDPSNAYDTDARAVALGERLFHDARLSGDGEMSCATCHPPERSFQDARPSHAGADGRTRRRSMPLLGVGYNTWFFWDGRKDSLWAQIASPLEEPVEHGLPYAEAVRVVNTYYRDDYAAVFGAAPGDPRDGAAATRLLINVAKAIAAFVGTIVPAPARFDRWVAGELGEAPADPATALSPAELRGLRTFIGRGQCTNCHAGPLFTNGDFHFTRVRQAGPDYGRSTAIALVRSDPFNCEGAFSDARPEDCRALRFMDTDSRAAFRAFKTPTLRNVAERAPYMHAGQLATLADVLRFYRDQSEGIPELAHGALDDAALVDLEAFLRTLSGPVVVRGHPQ